MEKAAFAFDSSQKQKPNQSLEKPQRTANSMDIMRGDHDGVEFYTLIRTGIGGMSMSGMARLVGVGHTSLLRLIGRLENPSDPLVHKLNEKSPERIQGDGPDLVHKLSKSEEKLVLSKQLRPFIGNVPILFDGRDDKNKETGKLKIYRYDFSAAVIRHYAYLGHTTAQYSLDQFSDMGVLKWIQDITGWTKPEVEPTISQRKKIDPQYWNVELDRHTIYDTLINPDISAPMYRAYLYFLDCDLTGQRPTPEAIGKNARISARNLYDLVERMRPLGLVPEWLTLDPTSRSIEAQIRDNLQTKLGGIAEASCICGPIDLLTDRELIEVKRIDDWKTGLGQVIAKGLEYPQHQRHLYLFGQSHGALRNAKATCKALDITISFEKVNLAAV
jgi:hypothetical protein